MKTLEELEAAALELPPEERAVLGQVILDSLMSDEERAIAEEWNELAERRLDDVLAGKAKLIPVEEASARARAIANARSTARRG